MRPQYTCQQSPVPAAVGWPSFSDVADKGNVARIVDTSFGMTRTEVTCAKVTGAQQCVCVCVCVFMVTCYSHVSELPLYCCYMVVPPAAVHGAHLGHVFMMVLQEDPSQDYTHCA